MVARKKTDVIQLSKIRMREALRAKLVRFAERDGRTLNAEIVDRLERSFAHDQKLEHDQAVIALLVGGDEMSSVLLRQILFELQARPRWADTPQSTEEMAKRIDNCVRSAWRLHPDFIDHDLR
jgi:hypothetical protein